MGIEALTTGIAHVGIRVRDLAVSRRFYESLGFRFIVGPVGPEPVAILDHPAGIVLNFILNAAQDSAQNMLMDVPVKHPGYTHVALAVSDVDAVHQELRAAEIGISEGPVDFPGARVIFIRDPDQNVIEFNQSVSESR
jgi:lactoylglutathione lyase